jgi:hypothetical protein
VESFAPGAVVAAEAESAGMKNNHAKCWKSKEIQYMRKEGAALRNAFLIGGTIIALIIVGALIVNYVV